MKIEEAQDYFKRCVASYFGDSHVFFAEQKMARRVEPYITLKFSEAQRDDRAIRTVTNGVYTTYRGVSLSCEMNLYTQGKNVAPKDCDPLYKNTALPNMEDFLDYLWSDDVIDVSDDISITQDGNIMDLSALQRSSEYQYRSRAVFNLHITAETAGTYDQNGKTLPNESGGGNETMIADHEYIESVEINKKKGEIE